MTSPPSLEGWNVEAKMVQFENYVKDHLRYYKDQVILMLAMFIMRRSIMFVTNVLQDHIMFTMGDDFQYQNAVMNYKNMDKVIFLIKEKSHESLIQNQLSLNNIPVDLAHE